MSFPLSFFSVKMEALNYLKIDKAKNWYSLVAGVSVGTFVIIVALSFVNVFNYLKAITIPLGLEILIALMTCGIAIFISVVGFVVITVFVAKLIKRLFDLDEIEFRKLLYNKLNKNDGIGKILIKLYDRFLIN